LRVGTKTWVLSGSSGIHAVPAIAGRNAMTQFWVIGGEYADTRFEHLLGPREEWFGPFHDYEAAKTEWAKRAWNTVDDCHTRYRIERIDPDGPPPCTD